MSLKINPGVPKDRAEILARKLITGDVTVPCSTLQSCHYLASVTHKVIPCRSKTLEKWGEIKWRWIVLC